MRTFAVLVFIAGVAGAAIALARTPTIADGRVLEAEILPAFRGQGVLALACDREIPVGRQGARFGCSATLGGGATQRLDCTLDRGGRFACQPASGPTRPRQETRPTPETRETREGIPTSGDPWGN